MLNNIKSKQSGFTIVELLIVIVVIAILAAISIVAYNGIQQRGKASSAKSAATTVLKKAEAYNADDTSPSSGYPVLPSQLTSAASTTLYALNGAASFATGTGGTTPNFTTPPTTEPASPNVLIFYSCGATGGVRVDYWDYASSSANKWTAVSTGGCSLTGGTFKSSGATS